MLAMRILTPDQLAFLAPTYDGHDQPSLDKQIVRNYLETLTWEKRPRARSFPGTLKKPRRHSNLPAFIREKYPKPEVEKNHATAEIGGVPAKGGSQV